MSTIESSSSGSIDVETTKSESLSVDPWDVLKSSLSPARLSGNRRQVHIAQLACPACKRKFCRLPTHQRYAEDLKAKRSAKPEVQLSPQISEGKVDPFAKHPIKMTPELDRLLKQCYVPWNTDFRGPERHLFPIPRYHAALRESCNDSALLIGMLSLIATQTSLMSNGKIDAQALKLQNDTIKLQAKACRRSVSSDNRIITAMIIMSNHMANGKPEEMLPHMRAITSFVQQRGGLQYLGMDGIVADNIMFADHNKAIIYNIRPSYGYVLPSLEPERRGDTFSRSLGSGFFALQKSGQIDRQLYDAARDISLLTDIYDRATLKKAPTAETAYFAYLASSVEFQLAELNAIHHGTSSLAEMLTLAFLLINHTIFRNYGNVSPIMPKLEQRFWNCFDAVQQQDLAESPDLRRLSVWLAFTGVVVQTRRRCSFIPSAVAALVEIKREKATPLDSFKDVMKVLDAYCWSCPVVQHVFKPVWKMVLQQQQEEEESLSEKSENEMVAKSVSEKSEHSTPS